MNNKRSLLIGIAAFQIGTSAACPVELSDLKEAAHVLYHFDSSYVGKPAKLETLQPVDWERIRQAEKDLLAHQASLMRAVENMEKDWNICAYALARTKDPEVTELFIRLVRQNLYLKAADGRRMEFGFGGRDGCEERSNVLGASLAGHLGRIGDRRAVPALKEAAKEGDSGVRDSAYRALFRIGEHSFEEILAMLGDISFQDDFGGTTTSQDGPSPYTVMAIADDVRLRDPERAVGMHDRIIAIFPTRSPEVARAHFSKILCFEDLEVYDLALAQCAVALKRCKHNDYLSRIPGIRDRITKRAQQDGADQPATAPESKAEGEEKPKTESDGRSQ